MPPGAAEFAVGDRLQADLFLFLDDALDLAVFDRFQRGGVDFALGELRARLFQRRRPQQAADVIGAEGGLVRRIILFLSLLSTVMPAKAGIQ